MSRLCKQFRRYSSRIRCLVGCRLFVGSSIEALNLCVWIDSVSAWFFFFGLKRRKGERGVPQSGKLRGETGKGKKKIT